MFGQGSKVLCCWGSYSSLECWDCHMLKVSTFLNVINVHFFWAFWMHLVTICEFVVCLVLYMFCSDSWPLIWFFHHFWMHLASIYTFGSSLRLFALSFFWLGALLFWLLSICGLREVTPSCKNFDWIGWFVNFSKIGNCYRVRRNLWFFFLD